MRRYTDVSQFLLIFLLLLILFPRINIAQQPWSNSFIRIDVIGVLVFSLAFALYVILYGRISRVGTFLLVAGIFFLAVDIAYGKYIEGFGRFILILGLLGALELGFKHIDYLRGPGAQLISILFFTVNGLHFAHLFLSYLNLGGGQFLEYGGLDLPFAYVLTVTSLAFLMILFDRDSWIMYLVGFIAMATGDSRVGLVMFSLLVILSRRDPMLFGVIFFAIGIALSSIIDGDQIVKGLRIVSDMMGGLSSDPSLAIRIDNFYRYLDWVAPWSMVFGGGAFAFQEFSSVYGNPGPVDSLPLRILSEYGLIGVVLLFFPIVLAVARGLTKGRDAKVRTCIGFLGGAMVYSLVNEGIWAIKTGNLFFLCLGVCFAVLEQKFNEGRLIISR